MGGLGITNPCHIAALKREVSATMTEPLVKQVVAQTHKLPDNHAIRTLHQRNCRDKDAHFGKSLEERKNVLPEQTKRAADLTASSWPTFIPIKDVDIARSKREFKDAFHLRHLNEFLAMSRLYLGRTTLLFLRS